MSRLVRPSSGNLSLSGCVMRTPATIGSSPRWALFARFATWCRPDFAGFSHGGHDSVEVLLLPNDLVHHLGLADDLLRAFCVHTRQHERASLKGLRVAKVIQVRP